MPQQLAKLLLLWRREEEEVIEWGLGPVAHTVLGKDNAISDVGRGDGAFVPFIFPWFQYLLTNRNNLLTIRNKTIVRNRSLKTRDRKPE